MSTVTPDAYVGSSAGDIKQRSSMVSAHLSRSCLTILQHNKSLKKIRTAAVGELEIHFKYDVFAEILSVVLLRARGVANHSSDWYVFPPHTSAHADVCLFNAYCYVPDVLLIFY